MTSGDLYQLFTPYLGKECLLSSFTECDFVFYLQVEKLGSVVEPATPSTPATPSGGKKKMHKRTHSEGSEESPKRKKKKKKKAVEEVVEETNDSFTTDILERAMKDIGPLEMDLEEGITGNTGKQNQSSDIDMDKSLSDDRLAIDKLNDKLSDKLDDSDDGPTILIHSRSPSPMFSTKDIDIDPIPKDRCSTPTILKDNVSSSKDETNTTNMLKDSPDCAMNKTNLPYAALVGL